MNAPFPDWIPDAAQWVCEAIERNGGYSDSRQSGALERLFSSKDLKRVWNSLKNQLGESPHDDRWSFLIGSLMAAFDCSPTSGKRATRDQPTPKTQILDRQKTADKLVQKALGAANRLADALRELNENGGEIPGEAYSGLALIDSAIQINSMSRACCADKFGQFERGLSSYQKQHFPDPLSLIESLSMALDGHENTRERFSDNAWLKSAQSSWKDFVRIVEEDFDDMSEMYFVRPRLKDGEWTALIRVLLDDESLTRQVVSKGLKEL